MSSKERREEIEKRLQESNKPIKGVNLAEEFRVTRQVIVKDIAILRAEGKDIIATPEGYMFIKENKNYSRKIIALCHSKEDMEEELRTIVKYGGIIEDVIVEHALYGEIKAMLMIKTLEDLENFMEGFRDRETKLLASLTGGIHLHTIAAENEIIIEKIERALKEKGYLIAE